MTAPAFGWLMATVVAGALVAAGCLGLDGCAKPVPPPSYVLNPHPKDGYVITLTSDVPLPNEISVMVDYQIANADCVPIDYTGALGGIRMSYPQSLPADISYVSSTEIITNVNLDSILPHDYWGLGLCRWKAVDVRFVFNKKYAVSIVGNKVRAGYTSIAVCKARNDVSSGLVLCDSGVESSIANNRVQYRVVKPSGYDRQMFLISPRRLESGN